MRVGIIGGGQLGLMLGESLSRCGASVAVLDPDPQAPARRIVGQGDEGQELFTCAPFSDARALGDFVRACDVVTYEFESIDLEVLRRAAKETGTRVNPDPSVLEMCRSRLAERDFVTRLSLPCSPFRSASNLEDVEDALAELFYPAVLKTDRGGYDGKGQWQLDGPEQWLSAQKEIAGYFLAGTAQGQTSPRLLVESKVELVGEFSCIVARGRDGLVVTFPIFENHHRDHILDETFLPARLSAELCDSAQEMAKACAEALGLEGLLTVEFFFGKLHGQREPVLLINEFAPRPHNSGHITRRATTISQFDLLAMILMGLPPACPQLLALEGGQSYRMKNLLGRDMESQGGRQACLSSWLGKPTTLEYYDYGKQDQRSLRKMGHVLDLIERL